MTEPEGLDNYEDVCSEMLALSIKAGRRASYDLRHACSFIPDSDAEWRERFYDRADHWLKIFNFDSGMKDYTHSLHREIDRLEYLVSQYQAELKKHGIDDILDPPF